MIPPLQDDPMLREMFQAKLHHATVTDCRLGYQGSLTVDIELIERAGMLVNQKVQVLNISNGYRLETYLIPGERGKREIIVNGAAARHAQVGDQLIVITYVTLNEDEVRTHKPTVVILDRANQIIPSAP
jgi:aspartate 1-decarboxylase